MYSTSSSPTRTSRPAAGRVTRRSLIGAAATSAATLPFAGGLLAAQSTPEAGGTVLTLPVYPYGQELVLDPHRATNWGPHWVMLPHVWAGLLGFDENGKVVPVLANTVEPEDEGRVWVATIRSDIAFASGNPVTASALIAGWKRALDPARMSPMATYMHRVEGFDAWIIGEGEELGFEARDDTTVAITLAEPYAVFPEDLATFVWAAVDTAALDGVSDADMPFASASAGRWQFVQTDDPTITRMTPSPSATGTPDIDAIEWTALEGPHAPETAIDAWRAGEMPIVDAPGVVRDDIAADDELASALVAASLSGSTMLIGMDYAQPPFDNPAVRRAVAAAIDRDTWASDIMQGTFAPAGSLSPPVLAHTANYAAPELLPLDPGTAASLLAEAGIDSDTMPVVTYYQPAGAPQVEIDQAAALLAMIEDNAGLVIEHDTTLSGEQIDALRRDNGGLQFDLRWWWPLTNSPSGIATIGLPESEAMAGWFNWSPESENEEVAEAAAQFTTLIEEAFASLDSTERQQKFAQAEQLLVQQAVYVPLGHWVQAWLQSPRLTGTRQGAFTGYVPVAFDENVNYEPDTDATEGA